MWYLPSVVFFFLQNRRIHGTNTHFLGVCSTLHSIETEWANEMSRVVLRKVEVDECIFFLPMLALVDAYTRIPNSTKQVQG